MDNKQLFILSAREALKESLLNSHYIEKSKMNKINYFISKEATDYQIITLLMTGKVIREKENIQKEYNLLKECVNFLNENITQYDFSLIITEDVVDFAKRKESKNIINANRKGPPQPSQAAIKNMLKNKTNSNLDDIKAQLDKHRASLDDLSKRNSETLEDLKKLGVETDELHKQSKESMKTWEELVKDSEKESPKTTGSKISPLKKSKALKIFGAVVIAAAAIYAGLLIYRNYFSKAAKACKGLSGQQKTTCMEKYKQQAVKARIAVTMQKMALCSKSNNPQKCKNIIKSKIIKLKGKL